MIKSATFEHLEARRLLAGEAGTWTITGTDAANLITIERDPDTLSKIRVRMDGKVVGSRTLSELAMLQVFAGASDDLVIVDLHQATPDVQIWISGGTGDDHIIGGAGDEMILGGNGRDTIEGGRGNDTLRGGRGHDAVFGDDGDDYIQGNAGTDTLAGGWGLDKLTGGKGIDQLQGGNDDDVLYGGRGADTVKGGAGGDWLSGGGAANNVFRQLSADFLVPNELDTTSDDETEQPLERLLSQDELRQWIIDSAVAQWAWALGQPVGGYWGYALGTVVFAASNATLSDSIRGSYSSTNTQEQNVDEADLVETDGEYLYILNGQELIIADAVPADQINIKSRTGIDGLARGIYLDGDRLTVLSMTGGYGYWFTGGLVSVDFAGDAPPDKPQITVTVFNVSNHVAPEVVETTIVDGNLNTSRMIDGRLYLVMQNYISAPAPAFLDGETESDKVYESEESYRARLESGAIDDMLPKYTASRAGGQEISGSLISAPDLYVQQSRRLEVTSVVLLNVRDNEPGPLASTSVLTADRVVYASEDSLYFAGYSWLIDDQTDVVKFSLGISQVALEASGMVEGRELNQFSMDEEGDYFRIATSEARNESNNVFVLDQVGEELDVVGSIEGIAVGERIFSARFIGDKGYLVTFRQIDPLFTLDLSDPFDPKVVGEMKIPGFSNYLHPVNDNYLIGLGRDGQALQLSLFNVSDPANPVRVGVYTFEDEGWTNSAGEWDHHAFSFFPEQGIVAVPVARTVDGQQKTVLDVLKVNLASGFERVGTVEHDGQALRSVRIGQHLYSIATDSVKIRDLNDFEAEVGEVEIAK